MDNGRNIVGDDRTEGQRDTHDFYPTPPHVTRHLLEVENFEGTIWEPAAGDGRMAKVLEQDHEVIATELREADHVYGTGGVDFLQTTKEVDNIITNPPFSLAEEFVRHALDCADQKVAIFAKLTFLESQSRYELFEDTPLKTVYVFSKRVTLSKYGEQDVGSGMVAYAWYVWEQGYEGEPTIEWIMNDGRLKGQETLEGF